MTFKASFSFAVLVIVLGLSLICSSAALAERIFMAGYKGGFYLKSEEEGGMELRFGGSFQGNYSWYGEPERADNRFDIRRARLIFNGALTRWFRFGMEYEFQGNETSNLLDAYGELVLPPHAIRMGQFKEPFSLEWQTADKAITFAERSMGYYLGPKRDIGVMLHGDLFQEDMAYGIGLFNGDGDDGSTKGNEHDDPEIALRAVFKPLGRTTLDPLKNLQVGGSATYARIDLANIDLKVKSSGMAGTSRNIYVLSHDTKFGVLQDVDARARRALETAWTWKSLAAQAEYMFLTYNGLQPVSGPDRDADFSSWYASLIWCQTGEEPVLADGVIKPIHPAAFFNPDEGTYGAFVWALRFDHFSGDKDWITEGANVSVGEADAVSLAFNWILFPMHRIVIDYTRTDFSDPLKVRVNPDGSIDYVDKENVVTFNYYLDF
ncbi:MAG: porin [Thermodesulfobacteriota bacterium]